MRKMFKGKGKEKVGATSSSEPDASKRRRLGGEEIPDEEVIYMNPTWDSGQLSSFAKEHQAGFFREKMNKLQNKKEGFVCEKEVPEKEFRPFGVHEKFKALGWEAALKCYDGTKRELYMNEIEEWVSTLELVGGRASTQIKLVGSVGEVQVTMSFETLNQIAKFDSKPANRYRYPHLDDLYYKPEKHPQWVAMLEDLFLPGKNLDKLHREDLKLKPKLFHLIMQHNVIPRRGDKAEVRFYEIPVLYALMHGGPLLSFRYLVINNIWLSRDSHERKIVPHCRLITALLKRAGVINSESVGRSKRFTPFNVKNLGVNWIYGESNTHLILKNATRDRKWVVLKNGSGVNSGDEMESDDEEGRGNEEEGTPMEEEDLGDMQRAVDAQEGSSQPGWASQRSYQQRDMPPLDTDWAHQGSIEEAMRRARPSVYDTWLAMSQMSFDHTTRMGISQERAIKRMNDRQEDWNRAHAYAQQREINHRYEDDRQRRMHTQWHAGQEVIPDPPMVDYTTLPPYDGSVSYPMPPLHHSEWINPRPGQSSQQPEQQQQAQDEGLEFGAFQNTFNQIFGPPQPRYY